MTEVQVRLVSSLHMCYGRNDYHVTTGPTDFGNGVIDSVRLQLTSKFN